MKTKLKLVKPKKARRFFARKLEFTTGPVELNHWLMEGANIHVVDVRLPADYAKGHIPGAVHLPQEKWDKPAGLKKDHISVVYCYSQVCHLAAAAACRLAEKGYPVMELEGGFETWRNYGLPIQKRAPKKQAKKGSPAEEARLTQAESPAPAREQEPAAQA